MRRGSRAQISLEALLLFAVFLSVLAIALAASSNIGGMAQKRTDQSIAQQAFIEFSSKVRQACTLGNGNVREFLSADKAKVDSAAKGFTFTMKNETFLAEIPCTINNLPQEGSSFVIENSGGEIEVSAT